MYKYLLLLVLLFPTSALAQDDTCPVAKDGGVCLDKAQKEELKEAVTELKEIHESPALITVEPIIIIRDWNNRVYVNGQSQKPLKLKLKIGSTIDRDLELQLPVQVHYREAPPPPMFRLRIRAQIGFLSTPLFQAADDSSRLRDSVDGGVGWDFFGLSNVNASLFTGVRSIGIQVGYDLTKNMGLAGGYSLIYDGFGGSGTLQIYFSLN